MKLIYIYRWHKVTGMDQSEEKSVFIIEDNEMFSAFLSFKLEDSGFFDVRIYASGEACIRELHHKPDLIILDYYLEGMNGISVLEEIRKIVPEIPVIVISGQMDTAIREKLIHAGAAMYIEKNKEALAGLVPDICKLLGVPPEVK